MTECDPECPAMRKVNLMKNMKAGITSESEYCQSNISKDASIESNVETDDVCVIAEVYSMTDIPDSLREEVEAPPKPGMIRAEICGGKCVVLNSYRDKAVNTAEAEFPEPGQEVPYHPRSSSVNSAKPQKPVRDESPPTHRLDASFPTCLKYAQINMKCTAPACSSLCPNLIISEPVQTDEITVCVQPSDQGDSTSVEPTISVQPKVLKQSSTLTSIAEQEEVPSEEQEDTPIEEPEAVPVEEPEAVPVEEPEAVPTEEPEAVPDIDEVSEEELGAEDMAIGSEEVIVEEVERIDDGDQRRRVFTAELYEMGTMLTAHSNMWLDRRKSRRDCGLIYAALSTECFYNDSRIKCYSYCARPVISHCVMQCIPQSSTSQTQISYCEPTRICASRCQVNRITPREKEASRCYEVSSRYRNPIPNDGCSSLVQRVRSQPCSVDTCLQSRPSRRDACNQYYLKSKVIQRYCWCTNGYTRQTNAHYCANYCNTANQTFYRAPTYCYAYSWC